MPGGYTRSVTSETPSTPDADARLVAVAGPAGSARIDALRLVLDAVALPSAVADVDGGRVLLVPAACRDRAAAEIEACVRENRDWPRKPVEVVVSPGVGAALVYAAILVILYAAQTSHSYGINWVTAGEANAATMRVGQWWRALTALTLHADVPHLGGNMLFGALFGVVLAQSVGAGLAWLTFVVAGGAGNLLNLTAQPIDHVSVGASTGVFGVLGAQVAFDWLRRGRVRHGRLRQFAPFIMGVALVAWLGNGGEHVDVGAHAFGFIAGLVCGAVPGWRLPGRLVTARGQEVTGLVAIALVAAAWYLALRP